jgi:hypothetical protein
MIHDPARNVARKSGQTFLDHIAATDRDAIVAIESARSSLEFLFASLLRRDLGTLPRPSPHRLLDQVKQVMRVKHYAPRTEEYYVQRIKRAWKRR